MRRSTCFTGAALAATCVIGACGRRDTASAQQRDTTVPVDPPRPALIVPSAQPYKVIPIEAAGAISGTVDFAGPIPETITQPADDPLCDPAAVATLAHTGPRIGGALVWLTDIRSGKALPATRRFELANDHCSLDPHVQVVLAGATMNVTSVDRVLHLDRFIDVASGNTVALAPFNDEGEVVPLDRAFTQPAEIEVICDLHPSSHAWLAVLDHPYYASTSPSGGFSIDGIPPGKYHVRAWHPALGVGDDSVIIVAGQPVTIALKLVPEPPERASLRRAPRQIPGRGFSPPQPSPSADSAALDTVGADTTRAGSTR